MHAQSELSAGFALILSILLLLPLLGGFVQGVRALPERSDTLSTGGGSDGTPSLIPEEETAWLTLVVIDAGHGGEDGGAVSAAGLAEKEVNLSVALSLRSFFEAAGIPVVMTRTDDRLLYDRGVNYNGRKKALDLAARRIIGEKASAAAAEGGGESLFISIHMNAFPQAQYNGAQVWYGVGDPRSFEVATRIQSASGQLIPHNNRQVKAAGSSIYLLHRLSGPAVLVECGFMSNPEEAARLGEEAYRRALAAMIFSSVMEYTKGPGDPP